MRLLSLLGLLFTTHAVAGPLQFAHQGRLTDVSGEPLNGEHIVSLRLVDEDAGSGLITENHPGVTFDGGYYSVAFGSRSTLDPAWFDGRALSIGISVDSGDELAPRASVFMVPLAQHAAVSDNGTEALAAVVAVDARVDGVEALNGGLMSLTPGTYSNLDVSGISTVQLHSDGGGIVITGLTGGVPGQVVRFIKVTGGDTVVFRANDTSTDQPLLPAQAYDQELTHYEGATYVYKDTGLWFQAGSEVHGEWHSIALPSGWASSDAKCRRNGDWIEFRGRLTHSNLTNGWPRTEVALPAECTPLTNRYTETPCHATNVVRNRVCNLDYRADGTLGIYTDIDITQIRFEGMRVWGGPE